MIERVQVRFGDLVQSRDLIMKPPRVNQCEVHGEFSVDWKYRIHSVRLANRTRRITCLSIVDKWASSFTMGHKAFQGGLCRRQIRELFVAKTNTVYSSSRFRRSSQSEDRSGLFWYHRRYGDKAQACKYPCGHSQAFRQPSLASDNETAGQ
ncbi:unnamed protein product [Mesocestoides corti]|uniref:Uncharacterized protein n=1 Tax=Mesocestoides corti TaxID=53468 RepID=A0A0R3UBP2_MESCO|nr:unnamed protein product [Mesocestoides corti]